jgi:hypothetical protein
LYRSVQRLLQNHGAMLCAMTICALFLFAAQVSSKQPTFEPKPVAAADPFALKNPDAFDPARRRSVRAMKEPRESVEAMASGLDAAEIERPEPMEESDAPPAKIAKAN